MTPDPTFTTPSAHVRSAREALARLQHHLDLVLDPMTESVLATDLAFAVLGLEDVYPPYPPLAGEPGPSEDPAADFDTAIRALLVASSEAATARETLRCAYVIRDLRAMESDPAFPLAVAAGGQGR
ncbi:MAG: hypothetical protein ACT4QF_02915 [Sporichthyaceae bacterium]